MHGVSPSLSFIRTCAQQACSARRWSATADLNDRCAGPKDLTMTTDTKKTRKHYLPIKVYCFPHEREAIEEAARGSAMSTSRFLNQVGQGYRVTGILDYKAVEDLVRINGDLGRLGGLLKLWLTDDVRTAGYGVPVIRGLLDRLEERQQEVRAAIALVFPTADDSA